MVLIYLVALQTAAATPIVLSSIGPASPVSVTAPVPTILLPHDTPVELMATAEVSTANVKPGATFKLRVNRAIEVDGRVIVPVGTPAFGEVTTARDSGGLGKSGRMTARLLHIQLGDVQIPLEGEMNAKGTGAGSAGVAFVLSLNPLTLFHRGNNAKIKAGELLSGFVAQDVVLDLSGGTPRLAQKDSAVAGASVPAP